MSGLFLRGKSRLESFRRPPACEEPALVLPRLETADDLQAGATERSAGLISRVRLLAGHSYFVEESSWVVSGVYVNEKSVTATVEGESVVTQRGDRCFNEVAMKLSPTEGEDYRNLEYRTVYEYAPVEAGADSTAWQASNDLWGVCMACWPSSMRPSFLPTRLRAAVFGGRDLRQDFRERISVSGCAV